MTLSPNARIFVGAVLAFGVIAIAIRGDVHLPGNDVGHAPAQPLAYSHRLHAGELAIDCLYCHYGARTSRHAGIPPTRLCMNCHGVVTAGFDALAAERQLALAEEREPRPIVSEALAPLYRALALDDQLQPLPGVEPMALPWVRVHDLPDFAFFDHSVHVARDVACQTCHGPVQGMDRVRQFSDLSMGWCLDCHRTNPKEPRGPLPTVAAGALHVSTDCASCHF